MPVINHRKIFYSISGILVLASLLSLIFWGLKPGIDFSGGSILDITYNETRPDLYTVKTAVQKFQNDALIRPSGDKGYIIRMKEVTQEEKNKVIEALVFENNKPVENRFDSIGPIMGSESLRKSLVSVFLVILGIVLYITFAFRKVSEPVSSSKYGLIAIVALLHDVIIPAGVFAILGHFAGYEVDTLFVTALLVILGFSVHDTIVVFDRVRENLKLSLGRKPFDVVVGESISQTFVRSINTSMTTLIALLVLYIFGGPSTEHFSLALIIGIAVGTYSSVFIGSPLLVTVEKWQKKRKNK